MGLTRGGNPSPELVEGNGEGASFISLWLSPSLESPKKYQPVSFGTKEKVSLSDHAEVLSYG